MLRVDRPFGPRAAVNSLGHSVLYRFFLFDWLFADLGKTTGWREQRAAWKHNRQMRRFLPTYLRRWGCMAILAFLTGWLCESGLAVAWIAAFWFVGFCLSVVVMTVIVVVWVFTADVETR